MEPSISESGSTKQSMVKEFKSGRMVLYMKDFGLKIWLKVRVVYITPMEIFMKEYFIIISKGLDRP